MRRKNTEFGFAARAAILYLCASAMAGWAFAAEKPAWPRPTFYTVVARPGETLPHLAARYGVSAAAVARLNHVDERAVLATGKVLRIPADSPDTRKAVLSESLDETAPNYAPPPKTFGASRSTRTHQTGAATVTGQRVEAAATDHDAGAPSGRFAWPVRGRVISAFGPAGNGERNDGINIAAMLGAPIHAAAAGTVTYAGDELKDYGNLILITHQGGYVTAYAHVQTLMVTRGDHVDKGQIIGTAGETGGVDRPQLHFEIREGITPVNPVQLLAALP
jgi:murein DD-endopeptidase MepM/ murein hydrolase activator NlpD